MFCSRPRADLNHLVILPLRKFNLTKKRDDVASTDLVHENGADALLWLGKQFHARKAERDFGVATVGRFPIGMQPREKLVHRQRWVEQIDAYHRRDDGRQRRECSRP